MKQILIIKMGASGDVVRTTVALHAFEAAHVVWLTKKKNTLLLPQQMPNLTTLAIEDFRAEDWPGGFDTVLSLDDDLQCAALASEVRSKQIIGAYLDRGEIRYTAPDTRWFDMSLLSIYGKKHADELKKINTLSYQAMLYSMLGLEFTGQEYLICEDVQPTPQPGLIGLEARAGERWPTKVWNGYAELDAMLRTHGYDTFFFENRANIKEYIEDIARCSAVVTGDTLSMHLALAMRLPMVGIFTCTSPTEIYDYGRMTKIVSPKLNDAFYTKEYRPDVLDAIPVQQVYDTLMKRLRE